MKRQSFINIIEGLQAQQDFDLKVFSLMEEIFTDFDGFYNNSFLVERVLEALKDEMNDSDDWITYFCYELNFGRKFKEGCCSYENGKEIDLSDAGKLYDFLKEEYIK